MKYINKSAELCKALDVWRQDKPLVHLNFYFWYNGIREQKSERGVLLSLLYQILEDRKSLIHIIFEERVRAIEASPSLPTSFRLETSELRKAIFSAFEHLQHTAIFISVDGLDEYSRDEGSFTNIAQFFLSFSRLCHVKLLLSSRPEREFETEFQRLPYLRLHDLALRDMEKYINANSLRHPRLRNLQSTDPARCDRLFEELINGSAGEFVWVCVVVKALSIELDDGEPLDKLEMELVRLPTELDDLYWKILERVPSKYKAKITLMLAIVRAMTGNGSVLSALGLSWAIDSQDEVLKNTLPFTMTEIAHRYDNAFSNPESYFWLT